MGYDIIYCCGDSHAAGGETVDDMLWPEQHPGFRDDHGRVPMDPRVLAQWRSFRQRKLNSNDPVGWGEWQVLEKQQAWPARLGEISGISVINDATIGSSMEWVSRQSVDGVSRLLSSNDAGRVLAIISPGTWPRLQHYVSSESRWASIQLADSNGIDQRVHEWLVLNEDDHSLLTRWLVSLTGMVSTLRCLGVRTVLLDPGMPDMDHVLDTHPELSHLRRTMDAVCDGVWHPRSMADLGSGMDMPRCPDLHWRREVHQLVAEDLSVYLA